MPLLCMCGMATGLPRQGVLLSYFVRFMEFCGSTVFICFHKSAVVLQLLLPRPSSALATFRHYLKPACITRFDLALICNTLLAKAQ